MPTMRNAIPIPALCEELQHLHDAATKIHDRLLKVLDGRHLPDASLPSLHASRRAAQSLSTHIAASKLICENDK